MVKDPHESEIYLLNWAKAKAQDFGERSAKFLDDDASFAVIVEFDDHAPKQTHKLVMQKPFPWELRGIAADTVKSLRDALDQAACHCTQRINAAIPRTGMKKRTHFPFGENPTDFDDVLTHKGGKGLQSRDIAPELREILKQIKPYPAGDGYTGNDRLKHIGKISGPNKHDITLLVGLSPDAFHFGRIFNPTGHGYSLFAPRWDREKNEAIVAETHADSYINLDLSFSVYIAFDDPLIGRYPVHLILRQWCEVVEDVVTRLIAETDDIVNFRRFITP